MSGESRFPRLLREQAVAGTPLLCRHSGSLIMLGTQHVLCFSDPSAARGLRPSPDAVPSHHGRCGRGALQGGSECCASLSWAMLAPLPAAARQSCPQRPYSKKAGPRASSSSATVYALRRARDPCNPNPEQAGPRASSSRTPCVTRATPISLTLILNRPGRAPPPPARPCRPRGARAMQPR